MIFIREQRTSGCPTLVLSPPSHSQWDQLHGMVLALQGRAANIRHISDETLLCCAIKVLVRWFGNTIE